MATLTVRLESMDEFFERNRASARELDRAHAVGAAVEPQLGISFAQLDDFLNALTPNKWRLLALVRDSGPLSIRAAAAKLGRDYKAVHRDATALIRDGFMDRNEDGLLEVYWDDLHVEARLAAA